MIINSITIDKPTVVFGDSATITITVTPSVTRTYKNINLCLEALYLGKDNINQTYMSGAKVVSPITAGRSITSTIALDALDPEFGGKTYDDMIAEGWTDTDSIPLKIHAYLDSSSEWEFDECETDYDYTLILARYAPSITGITDTEIPTNVFGKHFQNYSTVKVTPVATIDTRDPLNTITHTLSITCNGNSVFEESNTTGVFYVSPTVYGRFNCSYTISDLYDHTATYTGGYFDVVAYTPPYLSNIVEGAVKHAYIERCTKDTSEEITKWYGDNLGNHLWMWFEGHCTSITANGVTNTWSVDVGFYPDGYTKTYPNWCTFAQNDDNVHDNRVTGLYEQTLVDGTLQDSTFTAESPHTVEIRIHDQLTTTTYNVTVEKAVAYFDIEPYGVAVGQFSNGTDENPLFECNYQAHFYKGIYGADGKAIGANTYSDFVEAETQIGTFLGEPLYRVIYVRNSAITTSTSGQTISIASLINGTISQVVSIKGMVHLTSNDLAGWLPLNTYHNANIRSFARVTASKNIVCYCSAANNKSIFIIEYTKS